MVLFPYPCVIGLDQIVHSDVWGPLAAPNHGLFKYYVLFIERLQLHDLVVFNKKMR